MNGSGHPIDDKYASTRTALKELPLGGLLLDRCPSSGNGLIKMVSWKMYQNGEQELHHLTGHRRLLHHSHVIQIRGDSYRLKEKLRAGIIKKPPQEITTD